MVTIKDLARELHLNPSTVSRALNDSPEISRETKEQVNQLAAKYNYRPNRNARNLVSNNSYTIGFMIPDISDSFFSTSAFSIEEVLRDNGHEIAYYSTQRKQEKVLEFLDWAVDYRFSGVFITPDHWDEQLIQAIRGVGIPVVSLRRKTPPGLEIPFVDSDHAGGLSVAVDYLVSLGHRQIGYIGFDSEVGRERLAGYQAGMKLHGLRPVVEIHPRAKYMTSRIESGAEAAARMLGQYPGMTAICGSDDYIAMGIVQQLHASGIAVPQQFSVMGFDDREISGLFCSQISTVAQFQPELGKQAAHMMIDMIKHPETQPVSLTLQTKLVIRNSTGPCP